MPLRRSEIRMLPVAGVHEPQRRFCEEDHVTDFGCAWEPKYFSDNFSARSCSCASVGRRRFSCFLSRSSIFSTHSRSCARVNLAGIATTATSPYRNALTVLLLRELRRTSTSTSVPTSLSFTVHTVSRERPFWGVYPQVLVSCRV